MLQVRSGINAVVALRCESLLCINTGGEASPCWNLYKIINSAVGIQFTSAVRAEMCHQREVAWRCTCCWMGSDAIRGPRASISSLKLLVAVMKEIQVYLLPVLHVTLR